MTNIHGVYKIENTINGKIYIGESVKVEDRWIKHKKDLKSNNHHSHKLQRDWNEYGEESFKFELMLSIEHRDMRIVKGFCVLKEEEYIKKYDTCKNGYNIIDSSVESTVNRKLVGVTCETIKMCEGMIKRKTYDELEGRFINIKDIKNNRTINNKKSFSNLFSESKHNKIRVLEILELEKYIINPYGTLCWILVEDSNPIKIKYTDKILELEEYKRLIKLLKKYKK